MTYYAYFEQDGGCDYTIGCGRALVPLPLASSMQEALVMAREYMCSEDHDWAGPRSDVRIDKCTLLAVAEEAMLNVRAVEAHVAAKAAEAAAAKKQQDELAQLEALAKKHGKILH